MGRYEMRLSRQLLQYQQELERLQAARKAQDAEKEKDAQKAKEATTQPEASKVDNPDLASFRIPVPPYTINEASYRYEDDDQPVIAPPVEPAAAAPDPHRAAA